MIHTAKQLKDKVKNMSGGNSEVAQALIRTYFMERFLERVSVSEYRNNFILKGGMLVASIVGVDMRATMDIDTTVKALPLNEKDARAIIERIGELQLEDGITFKIKSVKEIMEDFDYPGIRMMIEANLERMRQPFKIDISTDDAITPGAVEYKYKLSCVDSCTRFSYVFPECFAPDPVKRFRENIRHGRRKIMRKYWRGIAIAGVVAVISGCGAASGSKNSINNGYIMETAAAAMDVENEKGEMSGEGASAFVDTAAGTASGTENMATVETGRKLIRTASMDVETEQFEQLMTALKTQIRQFGGYIENENVSGNQLDWQGNPMMRWADLTVRVPKDRLDEFLNGVESAGNVVRRSESTKDVTLQYSDIKSRKKTLKIEQDRLWVLLEKADSMDSIIALEERLSDIRYELESYESQLRLYDNQIEYSQVTLNINEVKRYTEAVPESAGEQILKGLSDNGRRLAEGVKNFGICVIITSPFWITAAVIGCLVWKLRKTFRSRKSGKIRIGRKKDTEVSQVKLQDYDHMQGGEKDNPAPDQRKQ